VRRRFVSLFGGIGNLLFQYCAAQRIAASSGGEVVLVEWTGGLADRLRTYVGPIGFPVIDRRSSSALGSVLPESLGTSARNANGLGRKIVEAFIAQDLGSHGSVEDMAHRRRLLKGYFQHPSWFSDSLSGVLARLDERRPESIPSILESTVGVHLRRGDYVRLGWELPLDYYSAALDEARRCGLTRALVVSDDQVVAELFRSHLVGRGWDIVTVPTSNGVGAAFADFHSLASAEGRVLSNSTFSWWAAKLGEHRSPGAPGPTFCPPTWIEGTDHLIDPGWTRVG